MATVTSMRRATTSLFVLISLSLKYSTTYAFRVSVRTNPFRHSVRMRSSSSTADCEVVSGMPPPLPSPLRNNFYLLRHGQSTANVAGIISSARSLMYSDKHGLTETGREQGRESAAELLRALTPDERRATRQKLTFYSSPFARARQTAEECLSTVLSDASKGGAIVDDWEIAPEVVMEDGIIERWFGRLDDTDIRTYSYVWPEDMVDVTHTNYFVESVAAVATRVRRTILDIDARHGPGEHVVLVSHADVLQITQLYATLTGNADDDDDDDVHVGSFSSYRFGNGEVRVMGRDASTLPEPAPLEMPVW